MMLGRPQKGWYKNGAYPLPASLAAVTHRKPFPASAARVDAFQSLLRSLPQPPPCPPFHHPTAQAAGSLPASAPSYPTEWLAGVAGGQAAC